MHILDCHVNFSTCGLDSTRHGVLGRFHSNARLANKAYMCMAIIPRREDAWP
jgi:hypothetical protein